ncbi:MAG: hypothetical protein HYV08_12170 [Deltaproteobacteria bacterium]|nr:hypothetical protein [Deltaproteobacteria bacterium]
MTKGTALRKSLPVILLLYLGLGGWLLVASWLQAQLRPASPPAPFPASPRCFALTFRVVTWPGVLAAIQQEHPEARIENQMPARPRVATGEVPGSQILNEGAIEADVVGLKKWLRSYEATTHRVGQKVQLVGQSYEITGLVVKRELCPPGAARDQSGR